MKKITILMVAAILALCLLPFVGGCQIFGFDSWEKFNTENVHIDTVKDWMKQIDGVSGQLGPSHGIVFGRGTDTIIRTSTDYWLANSDTSSALLFTVAPKPMWLFWLSAKNSSIKFRESGDSLTADVDGCIDDVAQYLVYEVICSYSEKMSRLIHENDSLRARIIHRKSTAFSIPPSPGYRESHFLVKNRWTNDISGAHFCLHWFYDGSFSSIWVDNFDMTDKRFEMLSEYLSDGDYTWADCCSTSTDMDTGISTKSGFRVNIIEKYGSEDKWKWGTRNPTKEDLELVKKKIAEFFRENPVKSRHIE